MPRTGWIDDLQVSDDNWVALPGGSLNTDRGVADEDWMLDCVRAGSRRKGDYTIQETLGGPWGTLARDCAINHALFGDQNTTHLWADNCPLLVSGAADLQVTGNASVSYAYTDDPGAFPAGSDQAHMVVRTTAFGVWLYPAVENLPERGILPFPDPESYGAPPDATIEWEADQVSVWKVEIADAAGNAFDPDPESWYAVNHNRQPEFAAATWGAWSKGFLPGDPLVGAATATFPSEAVAETAKTWYDLAVPASITEDYLNDPYDYGVVGGPAEAFGERAFTATRTSSTSLLVKAYVRSPRFRFTWGTLFSYPNRLIQRPNDGYAGGGTQTYRATGSIQGSNRTIGASR